MVDKFRQILDELKKKGHVSLFAVFKMDEFADRWSIAICADWIRDKKKGFNEVVDIILNILSKEEWDLIARVGVFDKEEYITRVFSQFRSGTVIKEKQQVNGFTIYEGYILASNDEEKSKEQGKEHQNQL
ncbi:MAG: hypothetical protein AAB929_03515 [Patescibacteria group bacterium]